MAAKTPTAPYTSVSDVDAFFERVETIAEPKPPKKVDSAWVQTFGFKTAHPSAIPSMLRWLGVINDKGESTGVWNDLRVDSTRRTVLQRLVRQGYSPVFGAIDVEKATFRDLRGAFVSAYSIGDPGRQIKCFLALCRQAGIPTAIDTSTRDADTRAGSDRPSGKKREAEAPPRRAASAAPGEQRTGSTPTAGLLSITLNIEIPSEWTETQIRERLAAVRRAMTEVK